MRSKTLSGRNKKEQTEISHQRSTVTKRKRKKNFFCSFESSSKSCDMISAAMNETRLIPTEI